MLDESGIETVGIPTAGLRMTSYRSDKWKPLGERVLVFAGIAWHRLATDSDLGERAAAEFEQAVKAGAHSIKNLERPWPGSQG